MKKPDLRALLGAPTARERIAARGGTYTLAISALVLAILIAVNVLFSVLPRSLTHYDISAGKLYSVTSNTKSVVNALADDVTIYWIVQADEEDSIIENLLDKYDSLSSHITVEKKNPDVYPTFAAQYTDATVPNNSLIVACGDKSRYIDYSDIYLAEVDYSTYSVAYSFDGEGAITSAIDYVTRDELPAVYVLTGHGEAELPSAFTAQLEKENMTYTEFSLLNEDALVSLSAESFTDETPAGKCELSLTLALDNARFPEVSIALYRADGSRCLAAADGVTVGYVPRSEVVDLIEAVNAIVLGLPEESGSD